ncbi:CLCN3 [Cordylochernes scorpioides]|uniref:CLCN3 n=1 Tax=Cordylochernes scorpioides TaxID=51811 RepID=A0ABY6KQG0_9ARAC|nr:CLCN3 [Cordylochernes scorpioides]
MHLGMSSSASPGSSGSAGQEPGRPSIPAPTGGRISNENGNQKILKENSENRVYANPPAGVKDVNLAAARDVTLNLPAGTSSNGAARVLGSWADCIEDLSPGAEDDFTVVKTKKRRRESSNSPTAAAPSSNSGGARSSRRLHSSARSVPRAQEIPTTRTHITEARARQASSSEEHCVYLEHGPELQPFHYLRALDRLLGGTAGIIQISKVNGHQLLGLANRGLAERLINNGLEVEGTLLRAFPFRKRAERITVSNLPFFVEDSAIINALRPFGRITSIAPKMMKAGPYTYTDGRREAFIVLHEGMTTERLPTRLDITIKGEAWPAYLSTGIKCSRCHGQGHRRANCPLLAGLANNTRTAPPTTPAGVPPPTTPAPPQRSAAQPPAPTPSNPAMEVCSAPPVARAALHSSAPRPSPPAAPAFPMEETPPAPPPVTPAPSLQTPGSREPAAPTPDVEMSIVEETLASFTSSAKNATRVDLDAFIEGHPSVSFAKTDALGLGREEVLDLLSSRTKAQRKGPLLSPPQCDALVGLIGQILDLRPGAASNLYKVLGQVKAELRTTPAVPPTPTLPAPWPSKPTPPALHGEKTSPDIATPPPPLSTEFIDACYDQANDIIYELSDERYSEPLSDIGVTEGDIVEAIIFPDDREPLLRRLSTQKRTTLAGIVSAASERARSSDPFSVVAVNLLEHSVSFSGTFLTVEGEQQNFPQMGTFWLRNRHFPRAPEIFHDLNYSKTARVMMPQRPERNGQSQSRSDNRRPRIAEEGHYWNETWIYGFDSEITQQGSGWRFKNELRPKKARKAPSKVKVMLTVFFEYQGIVHHEFQQQGSTITTDSYLRVLRRLREAIRQKRSELWRSKSWILHHDNAPAHTALKISEFLQDHSTSVFPQPPYSPDLAPCDFFLFGKLKKKVKGSEISEHRRDQSGIEEGHEGDPENRLPEVFCRLEKKGG